MKMIFKIFEWRCFLVFITTPGRLAGWASWLGWPILISKCDMVNVVSDENKYDHRLQHGQKPFFTCVHYWNIDFDNFTPSTIDPTVIQVVSCRCRQTPCCRFLCRVLHYKLSTTLNVNVIENQKINITYFWKKYINILLLKGHWCLT